MTTGLRLCYESSPGPPGRQGRGRPSHPRHRHPIRLQGPIPRQDRGAFVPRLCDEQAVEWVAVVPWQVTQQVPVTYGHGKREKTIACYDVFNRVLEVQLA